MKRYYEAGDLLRFAYGEYSDYCSGETYKATESFDLKAYIDEYNAREDTKYKSLSYLFTHLEKVLPLEHVEVENVWLGAYDLEDVYT